MKKGGTYFSSSLGKRGWQHMWTVFVMVLLEYRVDISRVKDQGIDFIGCTCKWLC
jgi:hypothetical protein